MKTLFFISTFLISFTCASQDLANVSGKIIDGNSLAPVPFATVLVKTLPDSTYFSGTLSSENGRFEITGLTKGKYNLSFSFLGYETKQVDLIVGGKNDIYDLGKIELSVSSQQLDEVTVEGKKEIIAAGLDKKSFSLDDNFAQTGGSVLDALRALPGITVDQEGKVMLRGSDRVAVFIDGKQSSLTGFGNQKGLDNIPTANIEKIEIINNPSAKYDAAGMAGVINIVYKKDLEKGFNGEVGLALGVGQLGKRKEDLPTELGSYSFNPKVIPSLSANYNSSKINFFLQSEVLIQEKLPNNEFTTRFYDDGNTVFSQVPENRKQTQYIVKTGLDWNIDDQNSLTFSTVFDYEQHTDTSQVPFIRNDAERYRYWHWREAEVTGYLNFQLDYKHEFEQPGHKLNLSLQYTRGWEDESYFLNDSSIIRKSQDTTHLVATEHTIPFLIDYVKPLANGRIEAGTKLQIRRLPLTYDIGQGENSVIYPGLGDWSEWGENIYAAYFNYVLEKEKYDVEAGLRAEQTDVFYNLPEENIYYDQNDSYDYFKLYPNVRFTLKIDENNNLSAFYNNRVDRPGEPELRIFPKYDDPELMKVGNPYLRPQFTQTFELAYKHFWETGSVYFSGYHRMIDSHFLRIFSIDSSNADYNIINKVYQNVGDASNSGVEVLLSQEIGENWKMTGSFNWYINTIEAYEGEVLFPYKRPFQIQKTEDNTWDAKLNNQIKLRDNLEAQVTIIYYAAKNIPQGKQFARSSVDIGLKKTIWDKKGEIIFSASDIFNKFGIKQELTGDGFRAIYENFYETQVLRLGLKYKW
ncbi:TonB-dependent receptor [Flammeovirgaceae bacterium SG7u.111]|nr:TonB-dependent receptor [Flammeovirgaceae bacterium SG7u.132]WPO33377.1 TonB-dependent receptor [Flammeovirgaceae bacterium SG7u.111]